MEMKRAWDELHKLEQFRPRYPNDRIVAWIFRNFARAPGRVVDILDLGCGAGRHAIFFAREGYRASACDFSAVGVADMLRCDSNELGKIPLPSFPRRREPITPCHL